MADLIAQIMTQYSGYTMTSDAVPEITSLTYVPFENEYPEPAPGQRLALVLVEPRLLAATGSAAFRTDLVRCLRRFKGDLRAEGLASRFILANLYQGSIHKDGQILLALRRFLLNVKSTFPNFEGAVLVGRFPDATLVRRVSWCPGFLSPRQLAIGAELISERADVVLGDLSGNWEAIYRQASFNAESVGAIPDAATVSRGWFDGESVRTCEFTSSEFTVGRSQTFQDAFYIDDAMYTILENRTTPTRFLRVQLEQAERNLEVEFGDRAMVNVIARPDLAISRLNAYHVAVNPDPTLRGADGRTFLDAAGNPQSVSNPTPLFNEGSQHIALFTSKDIDLERRLMIRYFQRNHRFRNGAFSRLPFRGAVISGTTDFNPDWYEGLVNAATTDFAPCVKVPNADLRQYVNFHKTPAVLKYIMAHSDARYSAFRGGYDVAGFTADAGGPPLRWVYRSGQHIPSFEGLGGGADIFTHRTLWHYDTLRDAGASLVIHGGCNVNSIFETQTTPYTGVTYGRWNNAEGILWYTNCVALLSRAKGFNDAPHGFTDGFRLSDRANMGSCWKNYFNAVANDSGLRTYNIQRKRAYFWSLTGDFSLRLRYRNGLGLLALDGRLGSVAVHSNRAWIDGWNFDAAVNHVRGIGDVDGDGVDEFIVTSEWGIGVLRYTGIHFRALLVAPRDTWFGGWRYDATVNPGRDSIKGVQDYTGTAKREVMIWSSWGIATLEYSGTTFVPSRIHANGTRLGGWLLNTADNVYCGSGRFDADARHDMVVTSPWGLGIISLQSGSHVYMAPNGTRFGGWLLGTQNNAIRLIADFDGDGRDEILISSPWGIGVLKLVGGVLTSVAMHPNGSNLGGYVVHNTHTFAAADAFDGSARRQILVTDSTGIHVLRLAGNALQRMSFAANGSRVDGWLVGTSVNVVQPAGDLNGDGRSEFVIRSPWGVGVMGIDGASQFRCYSMFPHETVLNDWYLQSGDVIAGCGNLTAGADRKELLIVKPS